MKIWNAVKGWVTSFDLTKTENKLKLFVLVSGFVLFLAVFTVGALKFTSTPSFCGNYCHEMKPEYTTWEVTSHAQIACVKCHIPPGVVNLIEHKMSAMVQLYQHATGTYERPIEMKDKIDDSVCEQCHSMNNRQVTPSGDLIIPHDRHKAKGIKCVNCHMGVAHGTVAEREVTKVGNFDAWNVAKAEDNTKIRYARPKMKYCMDCHTKRKVTTACEACHTVLTLPDNHNDPNWKTIHGLTARADYKVCAKCHSEEDYVQLTGDNIVGQFAQHTEFCYSCHKQRPAGHTENWLAIHKNKVLEKGKQNCIVCHDVTKPKPEENITETYCNKCHWFGWFGTEQPGSQTPSTPQTPQTKK